jgi:hypothetical protein
MSGNSTLYELRELLKRKLNAHQGDNFWTPQDLNAYLDEEYCTYHRLATKKNAEFGRGYFETTMPADVTEKDIPLTTLDPDSILVVEDYTIYDPGPHLGHADSFAYLDLTREETLVEQLDRPSLWYAERVGDNLRLYISPATSVTRKLRLHLQLGPGDFSSHDEIKSGLPDFIEKPLVLAAAITARNQEQNFEAVQILMGLLRQAKIDMARHMRSYARNGPRVRDVYDD